MGAHATNIWLIEAEYALINEWSDYFINNVNEDSMHAEITINDFC